MYEEAMIEKFPWIAEWRNQMQKRITSVILSAALLVLSFFSLMCIFQLEGNARVINYTGLVRGASQRLVVREMNRQPDDELIGMLDRMILELRTGKGENGLICLNNPQFQKNMELVQADWAVLKDEIYAFRSEGDKEKLFSASEDFFQLADQTVIAAEQYAEWRVRAAGICLAVLTGTFLFITGLFSIRHSRQAKRRILLEKAEEANQKKSEYLSRMSDSLRAPMNDISELMYVSDLESHELLFMNEAGRRTFQVDELSGQKCYRVLQGKEAPCDFCTTAVLKEGETYTWNYTNPITQRHYLLKDRLVEWEGRLARMEIAFDITETEREKTQLQNLLETEKMVMECVRLLYLEHDITKAVPQVLRRLGEFLSAERTYVFGIRDQFMFNDYEWCAEGVEPQQKLLQNIPLDAIDRWMPVFERHECIVIGNLEMIRETFPEEYEILHRQAITSMVVAPLERGGCLTGYLGVDNPPPDKLQNIGALLQTLCYFLLLAFEQAKSQKQLSYMSYYDALTSFYNRNRYMEDTGKLAMADIPVGIVYLDVNGLKDINDQYGHTFGDNVLRTCAGLMKEVFQEADLYRIGGDEFVIICSETDQESFECKVGQLKERFGKDSLYRAAIGARWAEKSHNLSQIIAEADSRMYEDKKEFYRKHPASRRYRHHSDQCNP